MNNEYELHNALWGALTFQYHRGHRMFSEQCPHLGFAPLPLLSTSVEKLWAEVQLGAVSRGASRHHFVACTYSAVRGLDRLELIAGDPERVLPGVLDHLLEWYTENGVGGLELTRQVGCVVGLLTASQYLLGLEPGYDQERDAWLNVLVGSVAAEMLYVDQDKAQAKTQNSAPNRQTTSLHEKGHPSSKRGGVPKVTALGQKPA